MLDLSTARLFPHQGALSSSYSALRGSLLAALGLTVAACGGNVSGSTEGGGGTGSSGSTEGGAATGSSVCEDPKPILQPNGAESGFVTCADGSVDRVATATCAVTLKDTCQGTETNLGCMTGADCTAQANGSCVTYTTVGPGITDTGC